MSCRQTGFAMLCEGSVQEVMDLAGVAHLSTIQGPSTEEQQESNHGKGN